MVAIKSIKPQNQNNSSKPIKKSAKKNKCLPNIAGLEH
jgi:hypothetical protein